MILQRFPPGLQDRPLFIELSKILDLIFEDLKVSLDKVEKKYLDLDILNQEELLELIEESGFEYIVKVLDLTEDQTRNLIQFIGLIHLLKGHRKGLELVLKFLGLDFDIIEWWEEDPVGEVATFKIEVEFDETSVDFDVLFRLENFFIEYVFPKSVINVLAHALPILPQILSFGVIRRRFEDSSELPSAGIHRQFDAESGIPCAMMQPYGMPHSHFTSLIEVNL